MGRSHRGWLRARAPAGTGRRWIGNHSTPRPEEVHLPAGQASERADVGGSSSQKLVVQAAQPAVLQRAGGGHRRPGPAHGKLGAAVGRFGAPTTRDDPEPGRRAAGEVNVRAVAVSACGPRWRCLESRLCPVPASIITVFRAAAQCASELHLAEYRGAHLIRRLIRHAAPSPLSRAVLERNLYRA
jgi:hypothetical protein